MYLTHNRLSGHMNMVPRQHGSVVWPTGIVIKRLMLWLRHTLPPSSAAAAGHHPHPPHPQHHPHPSHHHPPPDAPCPSDHTMAQPEVETHCQHQHGVPCHPYTGELELYPSLSANALS